VRAWRLAGELARRGNEDDAGWRVLRRGPLAGEVNELPKAVPIAPAIAMTKGFRRSTAGTSTQRAGTADGTACR